MSECKFIDLIRGFFPSHLNQFFSKVHCFPYPEFRIILKFRIIVLHFKTLSRPLDSSQWFLRMKFWSLAHVRVVSDTCYVDPPSEDRTMQGGNLIKAPFKLVQFHVHFGSPVSPKGSEHQVNSYQYPAEVNMQFCSPNNILRNKESRENFYKSKYHRSIYIHKIK